MELLTPTEVADRLRTPEATLAYWRTQKTGPVFHRVGRRVFYKAADVDQWLNTTRIPANG